MGNKPHKPDRSAYIYASARLHAAANAVPTSAQYRRMAETGGVTELYRVMEETGIPLKEAVQEEEGALQNILTCAFGLIDEIVPDGQLFDLFRYPYDCHNIKSAIKAKMRMRGGFETRAEGMMIPCGTLKAENVIFAVKENRFDSFPQHMAQAAAEATDAYAKTSDPQLIDMFLDRACYRDMEACAAGYKSPFFSGLVAMREDSTNIQICVRLLRMDCSGKAEKFRKACVPAGELAYELFQEAISMGEEKGIAYLSGKLSLTESFASVSSVLAKDAFTPAELEKSCDACCLGFVRNACQNILYGPEIAAMFLTEREREVKNLRIILSGKRTGVSAETIKERLRD